MVLDRCKVLRELQQISEKLFFDCSSELNNAVQIWNVICNDLIFKERVAQANASWSLPSWQGLLGQIYQINHDACTSYSAVGIDGSQIYPDKHQGSSCFLINIGTVVLHYGITLPICLSSEPTVFAGNHEEHVHGSAVDFVNCRRQELEFDAGISIMRQLDSIESNEYRQLLLFDGSLIFWHLESKEPDLKMHFLTKYCRSLDILAQQKNLIAGYISLPKNKDLVNLLRFAQQEILSSDVSMDSLDHVIDTHICSFFLKPYFRTNVFMHQSKLCQLYSEPIRPYFFYLHVGSEIIRMEIPAWIALDNRLTDLVAMLALDNAIKGQGYPVVLAEAHEQAVVKGPDRDFFYQLIQKVGLDQNKSMALSQKVIKKRGITI